MTLSFQQHINGKPNHFVQKIWESMETLGLITNRLGDSYYKHYLQCINMKLIDTAIEVLPKHHTIREDKTDRWRKGMKIHFVINNRTPKRYQFAPWILVRSTQRIFMTYSYGDQLEITIGDKYLYRPEQEILAKNDGFDSYEDFFNYFYAYIKKSEDECFSGKIIHWTDLRY